MSRTKIWSIVAVMGLALVGITVMQVTWIRNMIQLNVEQFDENVFTALNDTAERLEKLENFDAYANGFSMEFATRRFGTKRGIATQTARTINSRNPAGVRAEDHAEGCTCTKCLDARMSYWDRYIRYNEQALGAPIESRIDPAELDTILRRELADHGIEGEYTYGIYSRQRRDFILVDGHYVVGSQGPTNFVSDERAEHGSLNTSKFGVALFDDIALQPPGLLMIHFPQRSSIVMGPVWLTIISTGLLLAIVLACFAYSIFVIFRQKKLSAMKNDFISNMTHEFKTPIATISLAADSITNPKVSGSPEKLERFAGIIRQENSRMNRQVEKVLQAAQIDRRNFKIKLSEVDVNELLVQAAEHMALQVEKRGGSLGVALAEGDTTVLADRTHVSNVLHNLMDNANKYSPETPLIEVSSEATRSHVLVRIRDHGVGMARDDQRQIFDKFFRVHTGNRHDVKGFGLGLSYVKAIVEEHGGTVTVDSKLGEGSTFTVKLPRKPNTSTRSA